MRKRIAIGLVAVAFAGLALSPFLQADRFKERIHQALEQSLNRKVEIAGTVRFSILNGPGFSIADVVIHEDPAVGIEPFAYVASLDATLNLASLAMGRWEVSSILLDEPTVNLVKHNNGWNVRPLIARAPAAIVGKLPEIKVRAGRLNFKFDDTKSVLYCSNADVDLTPVSDRDLRIRFKVEPARTDRAAQGLGMLSGSGHYRWYTDKPADIDLDLDLQRSALADIATLLEGRGADRRGFLASRAKVKGPLSKLEIEGRVRLEDIQRFDLLRAGSGSWPIQYRGTLDFPAGELDLQTRAEGDPPPFRLRLRAHSLQTQPNWGTIVEFNQLPVSALRDLFQYMNVALPDRGGLEGKLSGVLGYSREHGMQGMISMPEASMKTADATARITGATLIVDAGRFRLMPAIIDMGDGLIAEVEGSYSGMAQFFVWKSAGKPLPIASLVASQKRLLGVSGIPGLDGFSGGLWQGALRYDKETDSPAIWNGGFAISKATLMIDGVAAPVEIQSASGSLVANRLALEAVQASVGEVEFRASYRREPSGTRPHKLKLQIAEADVTELEKLLLPTLRRSTGLLRTLSFRSEPAPEWLRDRHLDAQVDLASAWNGETWLGAVRGRLLWDGTQIEVPNARWEREDSTATGKVLVRLSRGEPSYRVTGEVKKLAWKNGLVEGAVEVLTSGIGPALIRNAKATGTFNGSNLALGAENDVNATGTYEFLVARGGPQLKLNAIEVVCGADTFTGQGASETDGRLAVELSSVSKKKMRIAGTIWPLQLEVAAR